MSGDTHPFEPNWTMHPGVHLREWLADAKVPPYLFAKVAGIDRDVFDDIVDCHPDAVITEDIANRIHHASCTVGVGPSAAFWMNADANYRKALARGAKDTSADYL